MTSLLLPSFYIAITTFHPEMIPFDLLISVSSSREIVPFPALMEALMMEVAFEALREASVRIPKSIGQAVSIIGALIIGTAAVQAGIVSAAMVIIVSLTGIASFIIPNFDLGLSFRLLRFPMMLLAGAFGIFGIACGMILIYVHMLNLESFGMPYLSPLTPPDRECAQGYVHTDAVVEDAEAADDGDRSESDQTKGRNARLGAKQRGGRRLKALLRLWKMTGLAAAIVFLAGCWSATELNNRAFVSVMILDSKNDEVELTLGIPLTNRLIPGQTGGTGGGSQRPVAYVTRSGRTVEEALQKIQGDIPRKVAFGQTHSIIMGSRFAQRGIGPLIEFISRNPFLKLNTSLFLVEGIARNKVSETSTTFERFFISVLNGYVRNHQILNTTVKDLMFSKANGGDGFLPILRFQAMEPSVKSDMTENVGTGGAAILREGKMIPPVFSPEETSSVRAAAGQLREYIYSVPSPTDGKAIGFYTSSLRTQIRPFKDRDGLGIVIRSYSNAGIIASDSDIDLSKQENIARLEKEIKKNRGCVAIVRNRQNPGGGSGRI
ncbi:spore germination protein [Cohnella rhizosphaerae]|uniref:Spore germination protein n=1 Tax=Cohnella rhizosphaerae TaxID=1457232 RepID=A0A9X4QX50_9BACL|nr:spore germination protein [Cohnella rhizosphaerae]MDG0814228.1 spore germination protein [Cohnella rhizosphaerae]